MTLRGQFEEDQKIHCVICVAAASRPGPLFFLMFKTSAGTSDVEGYCDCRHVCDDEESHHEDLLYHLFVFRVLFGLLVLLFLLC